MSLAGAKRFAKPFVRLECNRSVAASNREKPLRIFPLPSPVPHRKTKTLLSDRLCIHLPARRAESAVDSTATCPPASQPVFVGSIGFNFGGELPSQFFGSRYSTTFLM